MKPSRSVEKELPIPEVTRLSPVVQNMDPKDFARGGWVMESRVQVESPRQGSATYSAKRAGGVEMRKTLDYFVVSESLHGKSRMRRMWLTSILHRSRRR